MHLYLLRHGDAVENRSLHDSERPLSDLGLRQADAIARFFKSFRITPDLVLCSPLVRARQMAKPCTDAVNVRTADTSEYLSPGSDPRQLVEDLNKRKFTSALLVGHEPTLSSFVSLLVSGDEHARIEFKKATLALLETVPPIKQGRGLLKWLVPIDQILQ